MLHSAWFTCNLLNARDAKPAPPRRPGVPARAIVKCGTTAEGNPDLAILASQILGWAEAEAEAGTPGRRLDFRWRWEDGPEEVLRMLFMGGQIIFVEEDLGTKLNASAYLAIKDRAPELVRVVSRANQEPHVL